MYYVLHGDRENKVGIEYRGFWGWGWGEPIIDMQDGVRFPGHAPYRARFPSIDGTTPHPPSKNISRYSVPICVLLVVQGSFYFDKGNGNLCG